MNNNSVTTGKAEVGAWIFPRINVRRLQNVSHESEAQGAKSIPLKIKTQRVSCDGRVQGGPSYHEAKRCSKQIPPNKYLINAERGFATSRKSRKAAFDGRVDVLVPLGASPLGGAGRKHKGRTQGRVIDVRPSGVVRTTN